MGRPLNEQTEPLRVSLVPDRCSSHSFRREPKLPAVLFFQFPPFALLVMVLDKPVTQGPTSWFKATGPKKGRASTTDSDVEYNQFDGVRQILSHFDRHREDIGLVLSQLRKREEELIKSGAGELDGRAIMKKTATL